MQDQPYPSEIIAAVVAFLRAAIIPTAEPLTAFQTRVAVNALEMVGRQLDLAQAAEAAEASRLEALLGHGGDLAGLNAELSAKIASGELTLSTPGLAEHLWETTLAKLAVDQPRYAAYRLSVAERAAATPDKDKKDQEI